MINNESIFNPVAIVYPGLFKFRTWKTKNAISTVSPGKRKNIETNFAKKVKAVVNDKGHRSRLRTLFESYNIPTIVLDGICECITQIGSSISHAKLIEEMIDYLPTCVVLCFALCNILNDKSSLEKVKQKELYTQFYSDYAAFFTELWKTVLIYPSRQ